MRHGLQQRAAELVRIGEGVSPAGLDAQTTVFEHGCQLISEGVENEQILGRDVRPIEGEYDVGVQLLDGLGIAGLVIGGSPTDASTTQPSSVPTEHGDGIDGERRTQALQQRRHGILIAGGRRQPCQRAGVTSGAGCFRGSPSRRVDDATDAEGDAEEHEQGDDVLALGDRPLWNGGVKNQLAHRNEAIAATSAGHVAPTAAMTTTRAR